MLGDRLKCTTRRNFCSAEVGVCNRRFTVYQVDVADKPFWVLEMDPLERYTLPLRGTVTKFASHVDALNHMNRMTVTACGGDPEEVYNPSKWIAV